MGGKRSPKLTFFFKGRIIKHVREKQERERRVRGLPINLNLSGCGEPALTSVLSSSLAMANISSAVERADGTVDARVFTSKFTFFSLMVTVLPYNTYSTLLRKVPELVEKKLITG